MIVVKLQGGMGNQMFQYALGRILSIKNNTELVLNTQAYEGFGKRLFEDRFVARGYDLDVYNIKGRIADKREIPWFYRMYFKGRFMMLVDAIRRRIFRYTGKELGFEKYNSKILSLKNDVYLDGFFQSYKYFMGYEKILRQDFSLKEEISEVSSKLSDEISSCSSLCVNVRRLDFVTNKYHGALGSDYYFTALKQLQKVIHIDKIYIFSDDIDWCKSNLNFNVPMRIVDHTYKGKKFEEYLFLMSKCKHFIIPNSTFGWWGAWLSSNKDKVVICPKRWFGDASVDTSDLIPKEWIRT